MTLTFLINSSQQFSPKNPHLRTFHQKPYPVSSKKILRAKITAAPTAARLVPDAKAYCNVLGGAMRKGAKSGKNREGFSQASWDQLATFLERTATFNRITDQGTFTEAVKSACMLINKHDHAPPLPDKPLLSSSALFSQMCDFFKTQYGIDFPFITGPGKDSP